MGSVTYQPEVLSFGIGSPGFAAPRTTVPLGPCRMGCESNPRTECNSGTLSSTMAFQTSLRGTAISGHVFLCSHCRFGLAGAKPCNGSFWHPKHELVAVFLK